MRLTGNDSIDKITLIAAEQPEPFAVNDSAISVIKEEVIIGTLGKVRNDVLRDFGIKRDVYYFDLDFTALCDSTPLPKSFSPTAGIPLG